MRIKKSDLTRMVYEELALHMKSIMEAEEKKDDKAPDKDKKDAKKPPVDLGKDKARPKDAAPPELPAPADDPADNELEDSESEIDKEDPLKDDGDTGKKLSDELVGKSIQSITQEKKSKLVPGGSEIVITFDQSPDPFRILITKSGEVKFYSHGLHNSLNGE